MKRAQPRSPKAGSETIQIVILTLFMTGGGFALISAVLSMWLVPAKRHEYERQIGDHNSLVDLLDPKNEAKHGMYSLRARAREAEKAQGALGLRERVERELGPLQPYTTSLPKVMPKRIGKGGPIEQSITVDAKEAPLHEVVDFIARVKENNPSVQVGVVTLTRSSRGSALAGAAATGPADDKWTAKLTFHLFTTGSGPPPPAASQGPAAAEAAEVPEAPEGEGTARSDG